MSTSPDSHRLVTAIMIAAPANSTRLRSAIDADAPKADLICVVSAVSRDAISPTRCVSKKPGDKRNRCENTASRRSATTRSPSVVTR
jgi:hypothetical protein